MGWKVGPAAIAWFLAMAVPAICQPAPFGAAIWMAGTDPATRLRRFPADPPSDFLSMFSPDASWAQTAARTRVLKLPPSLVMHGSDADLSAIFADLRRRRIALGVEFGWLYGEGEGQCGFHVEGFAHAGTALVMARRIARLGGDLGYVAMDEPLYYGHVYAGANACQYPIDEVARRVAEGVAQVRSVFPRVAIGDIEPVGGTDPDEAALSTTFATAYRVATGTPLAFFHADIQWRGPWRNQLANTVRAIRALGMPVGIIYDGNGDSDDRWTSTAADRFRAIEADPSLRPDQAIFQSWQEYPTHMLPEQQPGTLTNLALQYMQR